MEQICRDASSFFWTMFYFLNGDVTIELTLITKFTLINRVIGGLAN